jgi:peptidyl-prolyl cis-trans isomerase A (cyclophilin A)
MLRSHTAGALALAFCFSASAQEAEPRVWLDTTKGPIILQLDAVNAPITTENFLDLVEDDFYDGLIFHRVVPGFVIQGGGFDENLDARQPPFPAIQSEADNGLSNLTGTIAMATVSGDPDSARTQFFINTADNNTDAAGGSGLDPDFTVFGGVVVGSNVVDAINDLTTYNSQVPVSPPVIRRAVQVAENAFPIMPLHTGAWFVPATSGTGFNIEIANDASNDEGPLLLAYWYDFRDGEQQWMFGFTGFEYGASEITLNMRTFQNTDGDFQQPPPSDSGQNWGTLTIQFSDCENGVFRYNSDEEGSGTLNVRRLSIPDGKSCIGL